MKCRNCGKKNFDNEKYCFYCGAELGAPEKEEPFQTQQKPTESGEIASTQTPSANESINSNGTSRNNQSKASLRKGILLSVLILIVAGVGITVALVVTSNKTVSTWMNTIATQAVDSGESIPEDDSVDENGIVADEPPVVKETKALVPTDSPKPVDAQVEYETRKVEVQNATYFKSASASSVLADQAGHNYKASNVLKNDGTCWCEDASGYGEGEWIKLELPAVQKVSGLRIVNGYAGTEKQYDDNSKISKMTIEFSDGRSTQVSLNVFDTSDRKTIQTIRFNSPVETEYVKLTIDSTTTADCKDTCLTFVEPF